MKTVNEGFDVNASVFFILCTIVMAELSFVFVVRKLV